MLNKNTPGVKKSKAKLEVPVSSYSYKRLKSVRPRPKLFASNNVISITYKFQKVQSLTLDVQQFEHN